MMHHMGLQLDRITETDAGIVHRRRRSKKLQLDRITKTDAGVPNADSDAHA